MIATHHEAILFAACGPSEGLPVVIEIVDKSDRIAAFIPKLDQMVSDGMVTLEKVNVLIYRHNAGGTPSS